MANKKRTPITVDMLKDIDEWKLFINSIPGRQFDGVDLEENADKNGYVIVAGYGTSPGTERRQYSISDRADMQAYAASLAGEVASINQSKAG